MRLFLNEKICLSEFGAHKQDNVIYSLANFLNAGIPQSIHCFNYDANNNIAKAIDFV